MPKRKFQLLHRFKKLLPNRTRLNIEIFIILFTAAVIFIIAAEIDAFERLAAFAERYEEWQLDEIFTLLIVGAVALVFITIRNLKYLRQEISQREQAEANIMQLAFYDSLTGLPNRDLCTDRLDHILKHATRTGSMAAVLFIDLDNFKDVNDSFGHAMGDELLVQVSQRLSGELRSDDTLARFAGDEFIIIIDAVESGEKLTFVAEKLLRCVASPYLLSNKEVSVGMSIGISIFPTDTTDASELIKHADTAMYHAKNEGKNTYRFFSKELDAIAQNKLEMASLLRQALTRNEFSLFYQPIFDRSGKQIIRAEALLRWNSPQLGWVSPSVFIPVAEEVGLIQGIGDWVLKEACLQAKYWQELGYPDFAVSVNMSARQLLSNDYIATVKACLKGANLAPTHLELELTESSVMEDIGLAINLINELKAIGITIAMDDFGTGYSSLSYLQKLEIDRIKIDRSFVMKLPEDKGSVTMVNTMILLAQNLHLSITAEGIETEEQCRFIQASQVDSLQGYFLGKPQSAKQFEQALLKGSWQGRPSRSHD